MLLNILTPICKRLTENCEHHINDEVSRQSFALFIFVREVFFNLVALVNVFNKLVDSQSFVMRHSKRLNAVCLDVYE